MKVAEFALLMVVMSLNLVTINAKKFTVSYFWRPHIIAGAQMETYWSDDEKTYTGKDCFDICATHIQKGTRFCRYILMKAKNWADWDDVPFVQGQNIMDMTKDLELERCTHYEHVHPKPKNSKIKRFISRGVNATEYNFIGQDLTIDMVNDLYFPHFYPNPTLHFRHDPTLVMITKKTQDFFIHNKCIIRKDTTTTEKYTTTKSTFWTTIGVEPTSTRSETTSTTTVAKTTTEAPDDQILYTVNCDGEVVQIFNSSVCESTKKNGVILYTTRFEKEKTAGCSMISFVSLGNVLYKYNVVSDEYPAGWCSEKKVCGFEKPLYEVDKTEKLQSGFIYTTLEKGTFLCYVKYDTEVIQ